jgi:hypothetical protein
MKPWKNWIDATGQKARLAEQGKVVKYKHGLSKVLGHIQAFKHSLFARGYWYSRCSRLCCWQFIYLYLQAGFPNTISNVGVEIPIGCKPGIFRSCSLFMPTIIARPFQKRDIQSSYLCVVFVHYLCCLLYYFFSYLGASSCRTCAHWWIIWSTGVLEKSLKLQSIVVTCCHRYPSSFHVHEQWQ